MSILNALKKRQKKLLSLWEFYLPTQVPGGYSPTEEHSLEADNAKPALHSKSQVWPSERAFVQFPTLPLSGGVLASHGIS